MEDHIQAILDTRQFSDEFKEQAVLFVFFKGEDSYNVMASFEIPNNYLLNNWVNSCRQKIESGLLTFPPMTEKQKKDLFALQ